MRVREHRASDLGCRMITRIHLCWRLILVLIFLFIVHSRRLIHEDNNPEERSAEKQSGEKGQPETC